MYDYELFFTANVHMVILTFAGLLGGYLLFAFLEMLCVDATLPLASGRWLKRLFSLGAILAIVSANIALFLFLTDDITNNFDLFVRLDFMHPSFLERYISAACKGFGLKQINSAFYSAWPGFTGMYLGFLLSFWRMPKLLKPFALAAGLLAAVKLYLFATVVDAPTWLGVILRNADGVAFYAYISLILVSILIAVFTPLWRKRINASASRRSDENLVAVFPHTITLVGFIALLIISSTLMASSKTTEARLGLKSLTLHEKTLRPESGTLWFCGFTDQGTLDMPVSVMESVSVVRGYKESAIAITDDGSVWEASSFDILTKKPQEWFDKIRRLPEMVDVCLGDKISLLLSDDGEVYYCWEKRAEFKLFDRESEPDWYEKNNYPSRWFTNIPKRKLHGSSVVRIGAGIDMANFLCDNGSLWSIRKTNTFGSNRSSPVLPVVLDRTIVDIAGTCLLDDKGIVLRRSSIYDDAAWNVKDPIVTDKILFLVSANTYLNSVFKMVRYDHEELFIGIADCARTEFYLALKTETGENLKDITSVGYNGNGYDIWLLEKPGNVLLYSDDSVFGTFVSMNVPLPEGVEISAIAAMNDGLLLKVR